MGKIILTFAIISFTHFYALAQTSDALYNKACTCISKIDMGMEKKTQYQEVASCVQSAIGDNQMVQKLEQVKKYGIAAKLKKNKTEEQLLSHCPAIRTILATSYDLSQVPKSISKKAKKAYEKGLYSYRLTNYKSARKQFTEALEKDPSFAMAWDMLGISADQQEDYRDAVRAYTKSIAEDPYGRIALIYKPIAHAKLGEYQQAIQGYKRYIATYPKNPEGFYRLGSAYHKVEDYEKALDNTLKSFRMFEDNNAPFLREALRVITIIHNDLTDQNRLDIWRKYSEKYNLTVGG